MVTSADDPLVRDLLRPENLPGAPRHVELRTTHGSLVLLAGDAVYKIKRAKDYGFFDYTTLAARKHFCEEEVRLNRRAAPGVYLGVLPVHRDARGCSLVRPGEIAEWAVHMRRLDDARSALGLLGAGLLGVGEIEAIAQRAARFYAEAERAPPDVAALRENFAENFAQVEPWAGDLVDAERFARTRALQEEWLARNEPRLLQRECRDGHGDLRLEHVYLLPDGVVFIDCIEFLARFRVADPALDAAFLAMDLRRHRRRDLAESFLAAFAAASEDYDLYPLVDGYVSYRAFVRAKVAGFVATDAATSADVARRKREEAEALFALAHDALASPPAEPRVIAVGGIIASGKSTIAGMLSRALHAPVVTADATRKHLAGLGREERGGAELYTPEWNTRTQREVLRRAGQVLASGRTVILDTTFRSRELRREARALAGKHGAPFRMVECRIEEEEARRRLRARGSRGVSDAREDLLDAFLASWEPIDELPPAELVRVDTSRPLGEVQAELERVFGG